MYQAHYLSDKGIKNYLTTVNSELYRKNKRMYMNYEAHVDNVCRLVFNYFDVPLEKIKVNNRQAHIIRAKQFTAYFLKREIYKITLEEIGKVFNRDHATMIHSINKINDLIEVDSEYRTYHEELCIKIIELYK